MRNHILPNFLSSPIYSSPFIKYSYLDSFVIAVTNMLIVILISRLLDTRLLESYWSELDARKDKEFWLVIPNIGFMQIVKHKNKTEIKNIAIKNGYQKKGYGSALVNVLQGKLKAKVESDNEVAKRFYHILEFNPKGTAQSRNKAKEFIIYERAAD